MDRVNADERPSHPDSRERRIGKPKKDESRREPGEKAALYSPMTRSRAGVWSLASSWPQRVQY